MNAIRNGTAAMETSQHLQEIQGDVITSLHAWGQNKQKSEFGTLIYMNTAERYCTPRQGELTQDLVSLTGKAGLVS